MDNSKLISLLRTLDSGELRAFKDFLASPYFNKNQELIALFAYLKKVAPAFPPAKIQREVVFAKAFPGLAYDEKQLNYLMSFMLKLAEEFLGIQNYKKKQHLSDYHVLESLIQRNLDKHYAQVHKKAMTRLKNNPMRDTDFHYQQFLMGDIANKYFLKKKIRRSDHHLQDASDFFDQYYLVKKLQYTCEMLDREKIISTEFQHHLSKELAQYLAEHPMDHVPAISIYYRIYLSLTSENYHQHFQELKALLDQYFDCFPPQEIGFMMQLSLNFCIRKIRHQQEEYVQEALQLFIKGIQSKVLFNNGFLSPWTFKNVVKLGLRSKRYDWTEDFIHQYINSLKPAFRQNALHYNLADLYYYKKDFKTAQANLNKVEFQDIFYALHSKVMLLKIYFETQEEEAMQALLASFRLFLRRNKVISDNMREAYLNFTHLLSQLIRKEPSKTPLIKQKITNTQLLTDRSWLLEVVQNVEDNILSK